MKKKLALLALAPALLAAAPSQPAAHVPSQGPPDGRARFQGIFTDWNRVNRDSIQAERQGVAPQPPAAAAVPATSGAGSRALGERVGEIVASGDCAEGERIARQAGDFALVAAVRDYCNARPSPGR